MQLHAAQPSPRIVSLNWAISETLYAMRVTPVAAAETVSYDEVVGWPPTPAATVDVGLQGAPNFEYIAQLSPDIILIQTWQEALRAQLERCAPVASIGIYTGEGDVYRNACDAVRRIGTLTEKESEAEAFLAAGESRLSRLRDQIRPRSMPPLYLAQMIDDNNLTVFSPGSLFHGVLSKLGLMNAWQGQPTLLWGGSVIGVEQLAAVADAMIILIDSPGLAPQENFTRSPIWAALPAVRAGRYARLPSFWGFGAIPTALRFADAIVSCLADVFG